LWLILLIAVLVGIWFWNNKSPEPEIRKTAPIQTVEKLATPVESENRRTVSLLEENPTEEKENSITITTVA